ncbi:uncharacterized protein LOC121367212 [Gigantopelta aegis]|uniref:uncharacterized protein LOC121367212 n=1 Tax=Gigantopelta aegis TaxID=1735272 RepID=UPI001B889531|nr:uncharacterized protein LOC121367212 [Gigantopelta aegis]XP_041347252.1 uncharacterized protein LOC121367212 [Gigantopelta aegis]
MGCDVSRHGPVPHLVQDPDVTTAAAGSLEVESDRETYAIPPLRVESYSKLSAEVSDAHTSCTARETQSLFRSESQLLTGSHSNLALSSSKEQQVVQSSAQSEGQIPLSSSQKQQVVKSTTQSEGQIPVSSGKEQQVVKSQIQSESQIPLSSSKDQQVVKSTTQSEGQIPLSSSKDQQVVKSPTKSEGQIPLSSSKDHQVVQSTTKSEGQIPLSSSKDQQVVKSTTKSEGQIPLSSSKDQQVVKSTTQSEGQIPLSSSKDQQVVKSPTKSEGQIPLSSSKDQRVVKPTTKSESQFPLSSSKDERVVKSTTQSEVQIPLSSSQEQQVVKSPIQSKIDLSLQEPEPSIPHDPRILRRSHALKIIIPASEATSQYISGGETRSYQKDGGSRLYEITVDLRDESKRSRPSPWKDPTMDGKLYTDQEFPRNIAIENVVVADKGDIIEWKRPGDFYENPVLFPDKTTVYRTGRRQDRTSRFLSVLANLSRDRRIIHNVILEDSWDPKTGVFKCRLFNFGQWQTIYTDDFVPVVKSKPLWGTVEKEYKEEVWEALLVKGFARFNGSYDSIVHGQTGDAFFALTGGVAERLDHDQKKLDPDYLLERISSALQSGARISCCCESDDQGLLAKHSYVVNGMTLVNTRDGSTVCLVRMKNLFGRGCWTGPWSEWSEEWSTLEDEGVVEKATSEKAEFWIRLSDFIKYFSHQTICSLSTRVDASGIAGPLDHITNIYGEWKDAADPRNKHQIYFTISEEGMTTAGFVPVCVQIIQRTTRSQDRVAIKCELLKRKDSGVELVEENHSNYGTGIQVSNMYRLQPGEYLLRPKARKIVPGKEFLIRFFTAYSLAEIKYM